MLADCGHSLAKAVLVVKVDISAGPAKWNRTKPAPEVSGCTGSFWSATHYARVRELLYGWLLFGRIERQR